MIIADRAPSTRSPRTVAEWQSIRWPICSSGIASEARLAARRLSSLTLVLLVAIRSLIAGARRHTASWCRRSSRTMPAVAARRVCVTCRWLLFLPGLPFFVIALADPYSALVSRGRVVPGPPDRLMVDASTSMRTPFTAATLNKRAATDAAFFTTVAAAERFVGCA